jgi:ABC-type transport system involved in multi-copper enzyme maturation permease subunit
MSSSDISSLSKGQKNSLAVSYAVLILSDSGKDISSENLSSLIKSAKLEVWAKLNADRQWIPLDLRERA